MGLFDDIGFGSFIPFVGTDPIYKGAQDKKRKDAGLADQNASNEAQNTALTEEMKASLAGLRTQASGLKAPTALGREGDYQNEGYQNETYKNDTNAYKAKDVSGALPQYDLLRNKANQDYNETRGASQDAIQRRFASMGNLNSGAFEKASSGMEAKLSAQRDAAMQGIGFQESQDRQNLANIEGQKEFSSNEALNSRNFQGQQGAMSRNMAGQQAALGRNFQGQQAVASRNYARDQFNTQIGNQFQQAQLDNNTKIAGMDMTMKNADMDRRTTAYLQAMENERAQHQGGLLGSGGFLGLGFSL